MIMVFQIKAVLLIMMLNQIMYWKLQILIKKFEIVMSDALFDHILDIRHPKGKISKIKYDENCFIEGITKMIENHILMYNGIELRKTRMIFYYNIEPASVLRLGLILMMTMRKMEMVYRMRRN